MYNDKKAGGEKMYKLVPKCTIRRKEEKSHSFKLRQWIAMLDLCREQDDDMWKNLMIERIDDLNALREDEEIYKNE